MIDFFDLLVDPRDHGKLEHTNNTLRAKDRKQFTLAKRLSDCDLESLNR